ncbi:MAG: DUF1501 domain-containing protein [Pirellulales bacterium]
MLRINGRTARVCDGFTRREVLEVGGLGALGLMLSDVLRLQSRAANSAQQARKADACILVFLFGGPSQIDTFDMKPLAPSEFRGEFQPIETNVPGISICEHFPQLAAQADKFAILRSMNHLHPRHGYGLHYMFTGREHPRPDLDAPPTPGDFPSLGSLVAKLQAPRADFPPAVTLPRWNRFLDVPNDYAGELAGFLGKNYDPWLVRAEPNTSEFAVSGIDLPAGMSIDRLAGRRELLDSIKSRLARIADTEQVGQHDSLYRQAFALVTSPQARVAFDLEREPAALRDRYGQGPFGQGLLLSRRLVEAGASLVTVNWHDDGSDVKSPFWDTHKDNFRTLKDKLIPPVDRGLSALLQDLSARGLLDRTLVIVMGEFGRTPRIGRVVMNAATDSTGRDHWPHAYSVLLAGGGVRGGQVYGASDDRAAYVVDGSVTPPDLVATVLTCLGIDTASRIYDRQGRPHFACEGRPITGLF